MKNPQQKFLVIGATGLIGGALIKQLDSRFSWEGTYYRCSAQHLHQLDVTDKKSTQIVIEKAAPGCVILCSNLAGGVQFCEDNPVVAELWHYQAVVNVAEVCRLINAKFIYISSECVFDGGKEAYSEEDPVCPINVYGGFKAKSEAWVKEHLINYNIVRTMSVFGWDPATKAPNALMKLYLDLSQKKNSYVPTYRFGTPTYVHDLAKALIELGVSSKNGCYHVTGPTYLSRYEWALKMTRILGWDASLIVPKEFQEDEKVTYPSKIKLETGKFCAEFKTPLNTLEDAINLLKSEIPSEYSKV